MPIRHTGPYGRDGIERRLLELLRDAGGALARSVVARDLRPRLTAPKPDQIAGALVARGLIAIETDALERHGAKVIQSYTRTMYRLTERDVAEASLPGPKVVRAGMHSAGRIADRQLAALIDTLRAARERQGLSRPTVAEMAGLSGIALEHLERGAER